MKIMAIGTLKALTTAQQQAFMPKEVPATLQVYLDGKIEQFWMREGKGPIFLMEMPSVEDAAKLLKTLPLNGNDLLDFELWPVGPLSPLGLLIPPPAAA